MKKLMCMILAAILVMTGTAALAADADPDQKTALMVIRGEEGDDPVPVYGDQEGKTQAALLKPGQFLGLIREYFQEGKNWYQVIYMDEEKKGILGYLNEDAAEVLTLGKLNELMQDPVKANELMDLLEAVNAYLKSLAAPEAAATSSNASSGDNKEAKGIKSFFELAMKALKEMASLDLGGKIEKIGEKSKEALGNVSAAMKDVLKTVRKGLGKTVETVGDKMKDAGDKIVPRIEDAGSAVADAVKKAAEAGKDFVDNAKDKAREVIDGAGDKIGEIIDKIRDKTKEKYPNMSDDIKKLVDSSLDAIDKLKDKISEIDPKDLKKAASDIWDGSKEKAKDAAAAISDKMSEAREKARELLEGTAIDKTFQKVKLYADVAKQYANYFKDTAKENGFKYALGGTLTMLGELLKQSK